MHIAITGNIGAGKTTLARLLGDHYGWEVLDEAVEGNPYLADFYADMPRWAFNLQVYFLNSRLAQVNYIATLRSENATFDRAGAPERRPGAARPGRARPGVVQDRTIYEDAYVFARNLRESGIMAERDYATYRGLFSNMLTLVRPPDLTIYLRADLATLRAQIERRGRPYEQAIPDQYLLDLNRLYEDFMTNHQPGPTLVLDVNELDYVRRVEDFRYVTDQIDTRLNAVNVTAGSLGAILRQHRAGS